VFNHPVSAVLQRLLVASMSDDTQQRQLLPSRYTPDGKKDRWSRLWLHRSGGSDKVHNDDDGVDPDQDVEVGLPPLPDNLREEGKRSKGRGPGSDHLRQLHVDRPSII